MGNTIPLTYQIVKVFKLIFFWKWIFYKNCWLFSTSPWCVTWMTNIKNPRQKCEGFVAVLLKYLCVTIIRHHWIAAFLLSCNHRVCSQRLMKKQTQYGMCASVANLHFPSSSKYARTSTLSSYRLHALLTHSLALHWPNFLLFLLHSTTVLVYFLFGVDK